MARTREPTSGAPDVYPHRLVRVRRLDYPISRTRRADYSRAGQAEENSSRAWRSDRRSPGPSRRIATLALLRREAPAAFLTATGNPPPPVWVCESLTTPGLLRSSELSPRARAQFADVPASPLSCVFASASVHGMSVPRRAACLLIDATFRRSSNSPCARP